MDYVRFRRELSLSRSFARPRFPRRHEADPAKALAALDLTDAERSALIAGDVGALFRMGVNGFLMGYLARFEVCGLNVQNYNERMRAVKVDEIGQPVA